MTLLDALFTAFDRFVAELGLEKIKTVGDAYMVASGVPGARPDHAEAIAELALRMRDHMSAHEFDGRAISMRIGINSGPGRRRRHRESQVRLRPVGRHRQHGEPDGIFGIARIDPGEPEYL